MENLYNFIVEEFVEDLKVVLRFLVVIGIFFEDLLGFLYGNFSFMVKNESGKMEFDVVGVFY